MKHPQHDNLIIAANDKDALFECKEMCSAQVIDISLQYPQYNWTHVKPHYKYQHIKDAYEADKSLVVQYKDQGDMNWLLASSPCWGIGFDYRIKPKTITKRLYANMSTSEIRLLVEPAGHFTIPINGTDTEVGGGVMKTTVELAKECGVITIPQEPYEYEGVMCHPGDMYNLVNLKTLQAFAQVVIDDYKASLVPVGSE